MKKNYIFFSKSLVTIFLLSVFTYIFFFSLKNIINYWTFTEIHINYSLGFVKRGFLGSLMLWLNELGLKKNIFFASIFYVFSILNTILFLLILNKKFKKNNIFFFIYFALNPALILFSFYDLGGYARFEVFGIFSILVNTAIAQKFYLGEINYNKYFSNFLYIVCPLILLSILIHEINLFFLLFHFFTVFFIFKKNNYSNSFNFYTSALIFTILVSFVIFWIFKNPFTKDFAIALYENLPQKDKTSFWIWESISNNFFERIVIELNYMTSPKENVIKYFYIFAFYFIPIFIFLKKTTSHEKNQIIFIIFSILPFALLFFIGRDWGRWIHLIIFVLFGCFAQIKERRFVIYDGFNKKILCFLFTLFVIFQLTFTRIPHCCNLHSLNLGLIGGLTAKIQVFSEIILKKNNIIEKRFISY